MIPYTETGNALVLKVQVVLRASRSEIVGEHNGALRVRIAAAPVDGAANEELIKTLARGFGVSRKNVEINSGYASKTKQVRITGSNPGMIELVLQTGTGKQ